MESFVKHRNKIIHAAYKYLLKPVFFLNDPEVIHDSMTKLGSGLGKYTLGQRLTGVCFDYKNPMLRQEVLGITFENPIGLSAGFDKNAQLTDILPSIGFGFVEVGSITAKPCKGNPKPRLWRLPKSNGLVVYYGLKNDGCDAVAERLKNKKFKIPVGISVAMTNCQENLDMKNAILDYAKAFTTMEPLAHYITVNISCPNTQGGQPFVAPSKLNDLLAVLDEIPTPKPIFIKLSPDLTDSELDKIIDVARAHRVHGIICTNLTKKRDNPQILDSSVPNKGGISGKVVQESADKLIAYLYRKAGNEFVLVGSGGVFTAADAYKKIRLGATLIQLITGMVFEGPQVISEINQGLVELLKRDGFKNIKEAIGVDNRL